MSRPRIDHIGVVVADLDATVAQFRRLLGAPPAQVMDLPDAGLRIAEFETANVTIEFIQYTGEGDAFARAVMGEAPGLNHVSLAVDDVERPMAGFPRRGAHGRVVFFEPESTSGVRIEICESD